MQHLFLSFLERASAVDIKDFHPISLLVGIYKVISKVVAKRCWEKLSLIHIMCSLSSRQILDSVLIANE
jgi:hypothetical protein